MLMNKIGKYSVPEELLFLSELDKQYSSIYEHDSLLGAYISLNNFRYSITPLDVIPFGRTGVDGIHLGFLTDYSQCDALDNAYIVCVSPMDFEKPISILSRNIRELLALWIAVGDPCLMDAYKYYSREDQFNKFLRKHEKGLYERSIKLEPYFDMFIQQFDIEPITDVYQYLHSVQQMRHEEKVLPTLDGLGVIRCTSNSGGHKPYTVTQNGTYKVDEISEYLSGCSMETKLALIRDLQFHHALSDENLVDFIYRELLKDNLVDEANNLLRDL
ncbi:hypothetical protein PCCS19_11250 [Paenibacillus sp. CCS19]|uniref:hypothetical protein n=1 Tax=Paenibacillus sp. CCS19 TaxID=3158387 RepID=UPI00255E80C7|nr:hypothetical protein [Paenibacillus cellulosilyticus]GMK38071.1 hypothetical protein PCCS19_11250 [Paenibacillus cellulosilyticus]